MSVQNITLSLPENIYQRFQQVANVIQQPLEQVIVQTIQGNLPPSVEDIPSEWQSELVELQNLGSEDLLKISTEPLPTVQWERHETLLYENQIRQLNQSERSELADLREKTDRFMFRRSYALALLKWRGISLPSQESLMPS